MFTEDRESGQAAIPLIAFFAVGIMASAGLAVDVANLWFHRQALQSAADSSCQAGAMDLLAYAGGVTTSSGFTPGTAATCTASSTASICKYASYNGFNSAGPASSSVTNTTAWNQVSYSFPSSVSGVTAPPSSMSKTNYLQVTVTESVPTYLIELGNGFHYSKVAAQCTCGLAAVKEAAPLLVLNTTKSGALTYSGGASLNIVGGPQRSVQVNSTSTTAITCSGSAVINTSKGGPNATGSDAGITGNEPETSNGCGNNGGYVGFEAGTTGNWKPSVLPIADPFSSVGVPTSVKSITPATYSSSSGKYYQWVAYGIDGCPDHNSPTGTTGQSCAEFAPGYYPSGITMPNNYSTVIFLPGVYYLNGSLAPGGSNTMRMAMPCWSSYSGGYSASACSTTAKAGSLVYSQGSGVMFYFLTGTFSVSGGASGDTIDAVPSQALTCNGAAPLASLGMPSTIGNNVLWGQCTTNGTYYDAGGDTTDTAGNPGVRGLLFFQDHANTSSPTFGGSGQLSFSGSFYFHSTSYADVLTLSGGTSSGTFIIGDIVADQVSLSGSAVIDLALPPTATAPTLKVSAFQ